MAARAPAVRPLACRCGRALARARPARTRRTPSWAVGSSSPALVRQPGQVGRHPLRRCRQGRRPASLGPGAEPAPGVGVGRPGVGGAGVMQGLGDPAVVRVGQAGDGCGWSGCRGRGPAVRRRLGCGTGGHGCSCGAPEDHPARADFVRHNANYSAQFPGTECPPSRLPGRVCRHVNGAGPVHAPAGRRSTGCPDGSPDLWGAWRPFRGCGEAMQRPGKGDGHRQKWLTLTPACNSENLRLRQLSAGRLSSVCWPRNIHVNGLVRANMRGSIPARAGGTPDGDNEANGEDGLVKGGAGQGRTIAKLFDSGRQPRGWEDSKSLPPQKRGLELWIPAFAGKTGWGRFHHVERLCNLPAGQAVAPQTFSDACRMSWLSSSCRACSRKCWLISSYL